MSTSSPERQGRFWLEQQGVVSAKLTRMSGYSNHVFLVAQPSGSKTVLRIANRALGALLCPLAHDTERVIRRHQDAAALGLAPELLAYDPQQGMVWLEYAGQARGLEQAHYAAARTMLVDLHQSGLQWFDTDGPATDGAMLGYLRQLEDSPLVPGRTDGGQMRDAAGQLSGLGVQRGYADYPLVPVHSDLNPGNWLYDEQSERWSLIDWDFSGMRVAEWDYAGLIVEHGWRLERGRAFAPSLVETADLVWFCAVFALLSWEWHLQRGSATQVIQEKREGFLYWLSC